MNNYEKIEQLLEEYRELDINIKGLEIEIKIENYNTEGNPHCL